MTKQNELTHSAPPGHGLLGGLLDRLADRRRARAAYRSLEAELASYTSASDVNDLLAQLAQHEGAEAERMRSILTGNLAHRPTSAAA